MFVYLCACLFIIYYLHTLSTYTLVHKYTYTYMCMSVCVCTGVCLSVCVCVRVFAHVCVRILPSRCICPSEPESNEKDIHERIIGFSFFTSDISN